MFRNRIALSLLVVWVVVTLALGGVLAWVESLQLTILTGLFVTYLSRLRHSVLALPAVGWGLAILLLLLCQLLPLPSAVVAWLSPHRATLLPLLTDATTLSMSVDRSATWLTLLRCWNLLIIFWLAGVVFENEDHRHRFAKLFLLLAAALAAVAISQRLGLWQWRGYASFINRNHAATFLVAALPFALSGFLFSLRGRQRAAFAGSFLLIALAVIFSQSRLAIVGLLYTVAATLALYGWVAYRQTLPQAKLALFLALGLLGLVAFYALGVMGIHDILPSLHRLQGAELLRGYRWQLWRDAFAAWQQAPLMGFGAGSFAQIIPAFRSYQGYLRAEHAENELLEVLVTTGAAGAVLLLCGVFLVGRRMQKIGPRRDWIFVAAIASLSFFPLAAMVTFVFELPALMILLVLLLALFFPAHEAKVQIEAEQRRWHLLARASLLLFALFAVFAHWGLHHQQRQDQQILTTPRHTSVLESQADWVAKIGELEDYTQRHPWDDRGYKLLGWAYMIGGEGRGGESSEAMQALGTAKRLNAFDPATHQGLAQIFLRLGEYTKAEEALQQSLKLSDQIQAEAHATIHYQLAELALRDGRLESAETSLNLYQSAGGSSAQADWLRVEGYLARQEWNSAIGFSERALLSDDGLLEKLIQLWLQQPGLSKPLLRGYLNQLLAAGKDVGLSLQRANAMIPEATIRQLWGERLFVALPLRGADDYDVTLLPLEGEATVVASQQSRWDDGLQDWVYTLDVRYPAVQKTTDWWGIRPQLPLHFANHGGALTLEVLVKAPYRVRNQLRLQLQSALGLENFTTRNVLPLGDQWYALELVLAPIPDPDKMRTLHTLGFNTARISGRYQLSSFRLSMK